MNIMAESSARDDGLLRGKHAVVTGASRGIGAAIAAALARRGADVTLMSRNQAKLNEQAASLTKTYGSKAQGVAVDLAQADQIAAAFARAGDAFGPPHILVNNAGIAVAAPIHRTELADWQRVMDLNVTGPFLCIRAIVKQMTKADYGRIINVASTAGLTGYAYCAAYCAAKHGLIGLTRALARELAHHRRDRERGMSRLYRHRHCRRSRRQYRGQDRTHSRAGVEGIDGAQSARAPGASR